MLVKFATETLTHDNIFKISGFAFHILTGSTPLGDNNDYLQK